MYGVVGIALTVVQQLFVIRPEDSRFPIDSWAGRSPPPPRALTTCLNVPSGSKPVDDMGKQAQDAAVFRCGLRRELPSRVCYLSSSQIQYAGLYGQ